MRSTKGLMIQATKTRGVGDFPNFVHLGHRHLQKEKADMTKGDGQGVEEFILPLDLMRMTVSPALLNEITEVKLAYRKG